jgi:hypothetical protein
VIDVSDRQVGFVNGGFEGHGFQSLRANMRQPNS